VRRPTELRNRPAIEHLALQGLKFRPFEGGADYDAIGELLSKSLEADHIEWTVTADDYRRKDEEPINQDPFKDRLIGEIGGEMVGFCEVSWHQMTKGPRLYRHLSHVVPELRHTGMRKALLRWSEARLSEVANAHPDELAKVYSTWANDVENDWKSLVIGEGYKPDLHVLEMVRHDLENLPELSLPGGVEVRPVRPEDVRAVWQLTKEAMRDERDYSEEDYDEEHFQAYLKLPTCDPNLWAVAWEGDRAVGVVRPYINDDENKQYNRKRGHTENIAVASGWRKKGIASALLARSLKTLRDCGMTSATMDVDAHNPSGALRVYQSLGFEMVKSFTFYQKPL
jgi:ribosomal protein S18 acetylase RimI-like enzyme